MGHSTIKSQRILELIEENHYTKAEVARSCGITPQSIDNFAKGSDMGVRKLVQIADFFGVTLDYFVDKGHASSIGHNVNGNGNLVSGDITLCECQRELEFLQNEIKHYQAMLEEKERTIRILLESQEYFNKHV